MRIDPNNLLTFLAVAEAGGFNRASVVLHKSQPALTRTVRQLEDVIGTPLFSRGAHGVELTAAGDWLVGYARSIRQQLNEAASGLDSIKRHQRPQLTIGTTAAHPLDLFSRATAAMLRQYRDLELRIVVTTESDLLDQLRDGLLNFVIIPMPALHEIEGMHHQKIFLDHAAVYCPPDHPIAAIPTPGVHDLHRAKWMLGPIGTLQRDRLEALFLGEGLSRATIGLEVEDIRLRRAMLTEMPLLSIMARYHVEELVRENRLVEVPFPLPQDRRPIIALQLSEHGYGELMTAFVDALRMVYERGGLDIDCNDA